MTLCKSQSHDVRCINLKGRFGYFERGRYYDCYDGYVSSMSLNLPIPFEVGDIVVLNSLPFAPVKAVLLTEVENIDCCGVWMLYRDTDGKWKTGALKHGHGWGNYHPILSPLYRLEKLVFSAKDNPELLKDDTEGLLRDLQSSLGLMFPCHRFCSGVINNQPPCSTNTYHKEVSMSR